VLLPAPWYDRLHVLSEDPLLGADLRAGEDFIFEGSWVEIPPTRVTISSQGLRDEHIQIPKPEGLQRLLCVGSSPTFGWGVEQADSFCSQLDHLLGDRWETVNLGIPGQNSGQQVGRVELQGLRFEPDIVLVQLGMADLNPHRALFRLNHDETEGDVIRLGDDGKPEPWDHLEELESAFAHLAGLSQEHGFSTVVFTSADMPEVTETLNGHGLIPRSLLPALDGPASVLQIAGDEHWTPAAHRRIAELMADELRAAGQLP
jgi:hypothetical protein